MSTRPIRRPALWVALTTALAGLPACNQLFFAEVDLPQVCITLADQPFQGEDGNYHADVTFGPQSIDLSSYLSVIPADEAEIHLRVLSGSLAAKSGVSDLGFIDALGLTLDPPQGSTLSELKVIEYTKDPGAPAPGVIQLIGSQHPDVYPYLASSSVSTTIHIAGTLPTQDWTADLTVCVSASAKVRYVEALQNAQAAAK